MATPRAQQIIDKVVADLSSFNPVAALILVGSQVEGNVFPPDQFSDIELYVVAFDDKHKEAQDLVQSIQDRLNEPYTFAYKNQWAGWSILFEDLLRLELPLVKASDDQVFARSEKQKIKVLYQKDNFKIKRSGAKKENKPEIDYEWLVKDFWYMAVYVAQHIGRGELWLAREAMRVSMQKKIKKMIQGQNYKETVDLERDRRIELTWKVQELQILHDISCSYERSDIVRAFWANIKYAKVFFTSQDQQLGAVFSKYEQKLADKLKKIINGKS